MDLKLGNLEKYLMGQKSILFPIFLVWYPFSYFENDL